MHRFRRSNPLALAVLVMLTEEPRHPYEISRTLRTRRVDEHIRLNFGSLYSVVGALEKAGLIAAAETSRGGRRPERTVYEITDDGRDEAEDWLCDLLAEPAEEYPQFAAALTLLAALAPDAALIQLRLRAAALEAAIATQQATYEVLRTRFQLPRLFLVETEYGLAMRAAELAFVEQLVGELGAGTFEGLDGWRRWSDAGDPTGLICAWPADREPPADSTESVAPPGRQEGHQEKPATNRPVSPTRMSSPERNAPTTPRSPRRKH